MNRDTEALLCAFARLSGMHLSVYDRDFHSLFSTGCLPSDHFCALLHHSQAALEKCIASDLSARRACLEAGRLYSYRCPFGLIEALAPIYVCGELNGFLMAGKSLPSDGEQDSLAAAEAHFGDEECRKGLSDALCSLSRHTDSEHEDICRLLEVFCEYLSAHGGLSYETQNVSAAVRRYLHKNFSQPITLTELAMSFHCSTVSLTKWYYREYGKTIMDDLTDVRMEHACRMLRDSDASVASVAAACGFSDGGYFSKRFRKRFGKSPTEWRETEE